ncbi:hypothetical protein A1OO_13695 [Enterovibrio norvegicus FF-33]|uniref:DUF2797 domain-containing protein n=1 Tax=Enterovibrio norvegicus FF-454 TaxID=1185651 RepID=A0A1E5CBL6_9GAMM|nr:DUF2797 domain-containing protein [Enterovibrio norvegicus]OEE62890.1 hypothetical protein A1OK_20115 [Enterovibrio norvegicus FF-454]OEE66814.1 hypothetical protein A1OO_13695 [Enterovibrio norvegicus FF-33]OEE76549.1 hypothetical protein A1OQ_05995 [Enterovibrio norvegicus FF-162]
MTTGTLSKMKSTLDSSVQYSLPVGENDIALNDLIGKSLTLTYTGNIYCDACGNKTKKSFSQGHCFPCTRKLARCDMCILKPETCHFAEGTCREPEWGEKFCMTDHVVYLSNTSGLKVGITRASQIPTRWIDQGATQALPILKVKSRHLSGLVEIAIAEFLADKTNWRTMLKGDNADIDLKEEARRILPKIDAKIFSLRLQYGFDAVEPIQHDIVEISFPVTEHPTKITSLNFDKEPVVSGVLKGIKGQYLLFDTGVINIRKFTGYEITADF